MLLGFRGRVIQCVPLPFMQDLTGQAVTQKANLSQRGYCSRPLNTRYDAVLPQAVKAPVESIQDCIRSGIREIDYHMRLSHQVQALLLGRQVFVSQIGLVSQAFELIDCLCPETFTCEVTLKTRRPIDS